MIWKYVCRPVNMYFVYLLECKDGSLYTGITTNVARRLKEHKNGMGGSYTRSRGVKRLVYCEQHLNRSAALRREVQIKKWSRQRKLEYITQDV